MNLYVKPRKLGYNNNILLHPIVVGEAIHGSAIVGDEFSTIFKIDQRLNSVLWFGSLIRVSKINLVPCE